MTTFYINPEFQASALKRVQNGYPAILSNPLVGFSFLPQRRIANKKALGITNLRAFYQFGGEGGIRTLDGLLTHTPLAGERLQPLGHLSFVS